MVGTPNYVAPEVLLAETPGFDNGYGKASDCRSLGAVMYEMVTRFMERPLFASYNWSDVLRKKVQAPWKPDSFVKSTLEVNDVGVNGTPLSKEDKLNDMFHIPERFENMPPHESSLDGSFFQWVDNKVGKGNFEDFTFYGESEIEGEFKDFEWALNQLQRSMTDRSPLISQAKMSQDIPHEQSGDY